jgi:hypothetical protein
MTIRRHLIATFAAVASIGPAAAGETVSITPPIYRDLARTTAVVRPASELTTTPRVVPTAPAAPRIVTEATVR